MSKQEANGGHARTVHRDRPKFTLALRKDGFRKECVRAGLTSDAAIAAAFRMDRSTIYRTTTGQTAVSAEFIAAALFILRGTRFDDLFAPGVIA